MRNENAWNWIIPLIFAGAILFISWIACFIDYWVNLDLIKNVSASDLQWWHIFTYAHYWSWLLYYDPRTWWLIYGIFAVIIAIIAYVILIKFR